MRYVCRVMRTRGGGVWLWDVRAWRQSHLCAASMSCNGETVESDACVSG